MIGAKLLAWIGGGASLALAAALAFVMITKGAEVRALTKANGNLAHRLELAASDLTQCRANGRTLDRALASQSAAVSALALAGEQRAGRMASAMKSAEKASSEAHRAARRILAATAGTDLCAASDRLILSEAGR